MKEFKMIYKNSLYYLFIFIFVLPLIYAVDYYELLGISKTADNREIRKAFKKLALKYHPDKNTDEKDAHEKFIEINKAYEVLKDEETRKKYDLYGEEGLKEDFGKSWKGSYHSWNYYYESFGIYDDDPEIITLSKSDFVQSVLDSNDMWFVNFYSPQCSHCHFLAPAWRELSRELRGVIRIGAVNCEEDWMLCRQQNIHSYPSLVIYPQKEKYTGSREAEVMVDYILQQLPNNVIKLSANNFNDLISRKEYISQPWLISLCKNTYDCINQADLKKMGIIMERMVNIAEINIKKDNQNKICELIDCEHQAVFYYNLSQELPASERKYEVIEEREIQEIVKKILHLLPEAKLLTPKSFQDIRNEMRNAISSPWLIHFTESTSDSNESGAEIKRLVALLPGVLLGRFNCEKYPSTCTSLYIQKYPTFLLLKPGGTYEFHYGRVTAHDVARFTHEALASKVQTLIPEDFPDVVESRESWFIDFFAPWCPPCMQLLPEWRKASQSSGHLVNFGSVDCSIHHTLCSKYNIRSYPTTILYNNSHPHVYHGSHSKYQIEEFVNDILHPVVMSLTPSTFDSLLKNKNQNEIWVIDFFAPWCGPCQQLAPEWRKLAKMLIGIEFLHIGEIDCQKYHSLCNSLGVNSYPTIRLYPKGVSGIKKFYFYNGWNRDAISLQAWIYNFLPSNVESLSSSDLQNKVLKDSRPWLVDFFAPWCSHCQMFAPEFEKISQALKGKVKAGKLNCEDLPHVCRQASIKAYPTVVYYPGSKNGKIQNFISEEIHTLTYNGIISFVEDKLKFKLKKSRSRDEL